MAMRRSNSREDILEHLPTLGLSLRKTPSLVNLIEECLSKQEENSNDSDGNRRGSGEQQRQARGRSLNDKPKASNFPAKMIKIGSWEVVAQNESQLVAKCYYAKKKLVWEVMENGLKSKIEIQWADITAIKATMLKDQDGILELELNMIPTFARERQPQAGKHSSWFPCTDFTGGQASTHRRHYLRFPPGLLDKPFRTLLFHDIRIFDMSRKPFPSCNNPYFPPHHYPHYVNVGLGQAQAQVQDQAQAQAQFDNFGQFSITNIPENMAMSNQFPGAEITNQNASNVAYCPPQLPGNNLPFGEQVANQFPEEPVNVNLWNLEMMSTEDSDSQNNSDSQYYQNTLTSFSNANDYTEPNNLDIANLENLLGNTDEGHQEVLANPNILQANSIAGQSYQQPALSNPVQFFDNPSQIMNQPIFIDNPLPGGQLMNNYAFGNYPCDMVYNQMDQWNQRQ